MAGCQNRRRGRADGRSAAAARSRHRRDVCNDGQVSAYSARLNGPCASQRRGRPTLATPLVQGLMPAAVGFMTYRGPSLPLWFRTSRVVTLLCSSSLGRVMVLCYWVLFCAVGRIRRVYPRPASVLRFRVLCLTGLGRFGLSSDHSVLYRVSN